MWGGPSRSSSMYSATAITSKMSPSTSSSPATYARPNPSSSGAVTMRRSTSTDRTTVVVRASAGPKLEPSYARNRTGTSLPSTSESRPATLMRKIFPDAGDAHTSRSVWSGAHEHRHQREVARGGGHRHGMPHLVVAEDERPWVRALQAQADGPERVEHASREEQDQLLRAQRAHDGRERQHHDPAHPDVEVPAEAVQRSEPREREGDADHRTGPHDREQ